MTFLSPALLAGLSLMALPVLLHLLNRGRTRPVPWGAMEILRRSIVMRTRRIRFEEALLLTMRCLVLALPVLAMARPFLPRRSYLPGMTLLLFVAAAVCAGMTGALWSRRRLRWLLLAATVLLPLLATSGAALERWLQARRWAFEGGERDWAIVIDGSAAMALPAGDGRTYFDQAMEDARTLAGTLRPGDTLAAFIGASVPVALLARPTADRHEIATAFADTTNRPPPSGHFAVSEALHAAVNALAVGRYPSKRIIVFGAGHRGGWTSADAVPWEFTLNRMDTLLRGRPELLYRRLRGPSAGEIRNLAVAPPAFSRRLVDTARPVGIEAEIINTGNLSHSPRHVHLYVNGEKADTRPFAADVPPGAAETVVFPHRFTAPGLHTVEVVLEAEDDLPADNRAARVVHVQDRLPVLIIDGAPSVRRQRGAAAFLTAALAPPADENEGLLRRLWAYTRGREAEGPADTGDAPATDVMNLVRPDVHPVADIGTLPDLRRYRAVILINVPRLPDTFCAALADFVREGNGLWILPGHLSRPDHFDHWRSSAGEPLLPAALTTRAVMKRDPTGPQISSFTHPAQRLLATDRHSDAEALLVYSYWRMAPDPDDPNVRTAGLLRNGDPFMMERSFGKGSVILSCMMVDREDSNLPSLKAFVPLVHETLYYLASAGLPDDNTQPGTAFSAILDFDEPPGRKPAGQALAVRDGSAKTPSGGSVPVTITPTGNGILVLCRETTEPGLYHLDVPEDLAGRVVSNRLAGARLSFAVRSDPRAAIIDPVTEADERWLNGLLKFHLVESADDLAMILSEAVPGRALWPWFLLGALASLLGEIAVSRHIMSGRSSAQAQPVVFTAGVTDNAAFENKVKAWFPTRPI